MRIDDSSFERKRAIGSAEISGTEKGSSGRVSSFGAEGDTARLSDLARLVQNALHEGAAVRDGRFERIMSDYRGGSYRVDPEALGQALLDGAFEG